MSGTTEIRFGDCTLRRDCGELIRAGRTIRLRAQVQQVLEALLERPGEVVTREALIARLWPKGIVDFETALNSAVRRLRVALDDDADSPRWIETLPRRGYRFIGTLHADAPAAPLAPATPRAAGSAWRGFVAAALALSITGSLQTKPASHASTLVQVRDEYGLARYFLDRRAVGDLERARERFGRAIALDPSLAVAHAGLASTYWLMLVEGEMPRNLAMPQMRASAERALALDPRNAEAHLRMGRYAYLQDDAGRAHAEDRVARLVEPEHPLVLSEKASDALVAGRFADAIDFARRAAATSPVARALRYNLAFTLYVAGHYAEAKEVNLAMLDVDANYSTEIAGLSLIAERRFEKALALAASSPDGPARAEIEALAYHGLRREAEADAALAKMIDAVQNHDPLRIVEVYAYRGDRDRAFEWLARASEWLERGNLPGPDPCTTPWVLRLSPLVASLREDPRWSDWVARMGDS
jgi:DNA-binding winged helix-turn-helix (wHTH) protein/Tfp pilus assembly protein PilF